MILPRRRLYRPPRGTSRRPKVSRPLPSMALPVPGRVDLKVHSPTLGQPSAVSLERSAAERGSCQHPRRSGARYRKVRAGPLRLIQIWLRDEEKAEHEWLLHCTGHNLSKLHGCGRDGKPPPGAAQCAAGRTTMWQQHISRAPPLQLQLIGSIPLAGPRPSRLTRAGC
jgi:hypothetical protein